MQNLGTQEPCATPHDMVALSGHEFLSIPANPRLEMHLVRAIRDCSTILYLHFKSLIQIPPSKLLQLNNRMRILYLLRIPQDMK